MGDFIDRQQPLRWSNAAGMSQTNIKKLAPALIPVVSPLVYRYVDPILQGSVDLTLFLSGFFNANSVRGGGRFGPPWDLENYAA